MPPPRREGLVGALFIGLMPIELALILFSLRFGQLARSLRNAVACTIGLCLGRALDTHFGFARPSQIDDLSHGSLRYRGRASTRTHGFAMRLVISGRKLGL